MTVHDQVESAFTIAGIRSFAIARISASIHLLPEAFRYYVWQCNVDRFPGFKVRHS
jgi:hypothetical protein